MNYLYTSLLFLCVFASPAAFSQSQISGRVAEETTVIRWIHQHAIPIQYVEAGHGFADLQPLKQILKDVKVVGLGEATHGTREFFQFKHRLFEFLVREMGYTGFALEASYAASQPINDYVLHGKGDRATVLTGQGYSLWDNEEFSALIDWMRTYNQGVPEEKKVGFYGLDIAYNQLGREKVLMYLQKYASEKIPATDSLFRRLAVADEKWPMWQDEFKSEAPIVLPQLQGLIQYLTDHKSKLVSASSPEEFEQILKYTNVMEQMLQTIITYPFRTRFMAENLLYLMEKMPDAKFVVSAHNRHINVIDHVGDTNLGHDLRAELGEAYYAIGFEANEGTYQTRTWMPEELVLAGFREDTLAAAPERSLPWYLSQAKQGDLFLNLRAPIKNAAVEGWWNTPQITRDIAWVYQDDPSQFFLKVNLKSYYDGILFIEKTTRARPTKNALELASKKVGF